MNISVNKNQRITISNNGEIIAYIDDFGTPIVTAGFFKITPEEWKLFWNIAYAFKVNY